jgi:hypothetical protein
LGDIGKVAELSGILDLPDQLDARYARYEKKQRMQKNGITTIKTNDVSHISAQFLMIISHRPFAASVNI